MPKEEHEELSAFGTKLRQLRSERGMTLAGLADALGYTTHSYLSAIETGSKKPTAILILKIARLFDVTTDELMKDEVNLRKRSDP